MGSDESHEGDGRDEGPERIRRYEEGAVFLRNTSLGSFTFVTLVTVVTFVTLPHSSPNLTHPTSSSCPRHV